MKELKLVVTGLIKDVQTKEEKLVKMEKETHQLKIKVDSMKAEKEHEQHNKKKCEKCDSAATPKTDISNHIEAHHNNVELSNLKKNRKWGK